MPTLSLTQVVDIVSKAGLPKRTAVRNAKEQLADPYSPEKDFYKQIREGIVDTHAHNRAKAQLASILGTVTDNRRIAQYSELIDCYKKWWGQKNLAWFAPPRRDWHATATFDVSINPEIGLRINNVEHVIKLYFKSEKLSKNRVDLITHLMHQELSALRPGVHFSVLDIRQRKLHTTNPPTGLGPVIAAEMAYIESLWPHV